MKDERNESKGEKEMKEEIEDKVFQVSDLAEYVHNNQDNTSSKNFQFDFRLNKLFLIASVEQPPELSL